MKPLIYIAGPYTHPDPIINTRRAIDTARHLRAAGFAVHVSHLNLLEHLVNPGPVEHWYQVDLDVLDHCDGLYRLPGWSAGADREVEHARTLGLPGVCEDLDTPSPGSIAFLHEHTPHEASS